MPPMPGGVAIRAVRMLKIWPIKSSIYRTSAKSGASICIVLNSSLTVPISASLSADYAPIIFKILPIKIRPFVEKSGWATLLHGPDL